METWVLIPAELSLALFPGEAEETIGALQAIGITVCSNQLILRGTCLSSLHGTVCVDNLQLPLFLDKEDVRNRFGCYDETMENGDRLIRRCNWTRFLRVSSTFSTNVNVLGSLVNGEPMYEVLRTIEPDTELLVYFEDTERNNLHICSIEDAPLAFQGTKFRSTKDILQSSPLDLSRSLMKEYKDRTASNRWNRILMTPPSESEGRTSVFSDNCFSPSDESLTDDSVRPPGGGRRTRERSLLPCVVCGKAFDRPSLLRRHMRTHTGEKPHVCNVCGKGFSTSSSLNTHKRIHSGEKPHQCPMCGKRFTASSNLYYHRMTHNKEKPHKCSLCSKSFPTPGDLKSHTYVHNGFWPYKCPICNRGFSKQTNLKNHLFLHTGDKPHTCNYCHKKFALACNLRAHRKTHDGIEKKNKDIDSGFDEPRSQKDIYDRCEIFPAENERNSQHIMNSSFSVPIPKKFMASRWSSQDLLLVGLLNQMVAYHRTDSLMNLPTPIPYKPMLLNT